MYGAGDGGDGGHGGDVTLRANSFFNDLRIVKNYSIKSNNGKNGSRDNRNGFNGGNLLYNVPKGTLSFIYFNSLWIDRKGEFNR